MIERIYYDDGSTYIDDDKSCTIRTDNLSIKQAMQLAFDTKSEFEINSRDNYLIRQAMKSFSEITNTKTFLDCYHDLSMHILNNNIIKDFQWDMEKGIPELFNILLQTECEHGYKEINNEIIEQYVRDYIADELDSYIAQCPSTLEKNIAKKYYNLFRNNNNKFCDIQHQIFCDNEDLHSSKIIEWIDVDYCTHNNQMTLIAYNQHGDEIFSKTLENITKEQAEETYNNIYGGMTSSDIYFD